MKLSRITQDQSTYDPYLYCDDLRRDDLKEHVIRLESGIPNWRIQPLLIRAVRESMANPTKSSLSEEATGEQA